MRRQARGRIWAVDRWLGWLVGLVGCILTLDQVVFDVGAFPDFAPAWNLAGAVVALGFAALTVAGLFMPPRVLTALWVALPALYVAVIATWPLAYRGGHVDDAVLWVGALTPAVATLTVLLARPLVAVAFGIGCAMTPAISALALIGEVPDALLLATPRQLGALVYVGLFIGARHQLTSVARIEENAARLEERQRLLAARASEDARIARLVHDEVLSVLTSAMNAQASTATLRDSASRAASVLDGASDSCVDGVRITASEAAACASGRLLELDESIPIHTCVGEGDIEGAVVAAVCMAGAEALRNSLRHGGEGASRSASIDVAQDRISLTVSDDGVGFTPCDERERLGISDSIRGRMRDIGGDASIASRPGAGTEVTLSWTKTPLPAAR